MNTPTITTVANELIATYGNTAKNVINAYRVGSERVTGLLEQRWDSAFKESRPQLSAEVAKNATHAQKVVGAYYAKGLAYTTDGFDTLVDQLVKAAGTGVERVAANASLFEEKTGLDKYSTLDTLAQAALPAAVAVHKLATQVELQSAALVDKIAGNDFAAFSSKPVSAFKKARAAQAA